MRSSQLIALALSAASAVSASWDWQAEYPVTATTPVVTPTAVIAARQDSSGSASASASPSNNDNSQSASGSASGSESPSGSLSGSQSGSQASSSNAQTTAASGSKGSASTGKSTKTSSFDARLPPGGIQMITPGVFDGQQYYKIGDFVTFAWNYTSLSVTPTAVNVVASCSANQATYTIAGNMSVQATGKVVWDTGKYQASATVPLLTESYTLIIYDASKSVSAAASAGYLASYNSWIFGMYSPQAYTPLNKFQCATCLGSAGALTADERYAAMSLLAMVSLTVMSFTWLATGRFGLM